MTGFQILDSQIPNFDKNNNFDKLQNILDSEVKMPPEIYNLFSESQKLTF